MNWFYLLYQQISIFQHIYTVYCIAYHTIYGMNSISFVIDWHEPDETENYWLFLSLLVGFGHILSMTNKFRKQKFWIALAMRQTESDRNWICNHKFVTRIIFSFYPFLFFYILFILFVCLISGKKWKARFKIRCLGLCDIDWCKVYWNIVSSKCKYYIIHIQYSMYGFCVLSAFEWQIKGGLRSKITQFPEVQFYAS